MNLTVYWLQDAINHWLVLQFSFTIPGFSPMQCHSFCIQLCTVDRGGPCIGVEIRDGPILVDRNVFRKFWPSVERFSYAVGFYPNNSGQNSPLNTVGRNSFDDTVIEIGPVRYIRIFLCYFCFRWQGICCLVGDVRNTRICDFRIFFLFFELSAYFSKIRISYIFPYILAFLLQRILKHRLLKYYYFKRLNGPC